MPPTADEPQQRRQGGLLDAAEGLGGAAIGKSQPHFPRLGHQPFHQGPQPLVFINQQLLAVQHWFEPLLKLALEDSRQFLQQALQLRQAGLTLLPLQFQPGGAGLVLQIFQPVGHRLLGH